MGIENKRWTLWSVALLLIFVFVGMLATLFVVLWLLPGAAWRMSAWPLYLGASLILAWVIVDLIARLKAPELRSASNAAQDTQGAAPPESG